MKLRRRLSIVFLLTSMMLLAGTLTQASLGLLRQEQVVVRHPNDRYDPTLGRLDNMDRLMAFTDSLARTKGITYNNHRMQYAQLADSVVRMRFYHGLQNYPFSENFLANLAGKVLWYHVGAKVIPDDILKGSKAFCSQSSIVFQELLRRKGFNVRSVLLPGHFCTEVLLEDSWRFFDVSFKPTFSAIGLVSAAVLVENPEWVEQAYLHSFNEEFSRNSRRYFNTNTIRFGRINAFAAPNMRSLHRVLWFMSWWGWAVFLGLGAATSHVRVYIFSRLQPAPAASARISTTAAV